MNSNAVDVRRLLNRLEKWIKKREAKNLECSTLEEACRELRKYELLLLNKEWDQAEERVS